MQNHRRFPDSTQWHRPQSRMFQRTLPWYVTRSIAPQPYSTMSAQRSSTALSQCGLIWVDGVGGYWVCWDERVVIGQPGESNVAQVPIWGDLSRQHILIRREADQYWLEPWRTTYVDDVLLNGPVALRSTQQIQLGQSVKFRFHKPHPWSQTARLDWCSSHRTQPATDGVLLWADVIQLGPSPNSHIVCPDWQADVLLIRQEQQWFIRSQDKLWVNDQLVTGTTSWNWPMKVSVSGGRMSCETVL
jgi:hypothetical protein